MGDARRAALLLLLASLTVKLQQCQAQWRPSYQPTSAVYNIHNDTFTITLAYNQWQGYFLNTYTVPAGGDFKLAHACSCISSFMLGAQRLSPQLCLSPDAWLTMLSSARLAAQPGSGAQAQAERGVHAGHSILDTTRNITWHMGNDLIFTLAPSSAADVDRTRMPHPWHALLVYIDVWQSAARGHRAYTDLSAARVRGPVLCTVCSLVNWEMTHM